MSNIDFKSRSGGIEGRPVVEYIDSNSLLERNVLGVEVLGDRGGDWLRNEVSSAEETETKAGIASSPQGKVGTLVGTLGWVR